MREATWDSALCAPHALTFLLTPEARATGEALRKAVQDFVTRQDVRATLRRMGHAEAAP